MRLFQNNNKLVCVGLLFIFATERLWHAPPVKMFAMRKTL